MTTCNRTSYERVEMPATWSSWSRDRLEDLRAALIRSIASLTSDAHDYVHEDTDDGGAMGEDQLSHHCLQDAETYSQLLYVVQDALDRRPAAAREPQ